jgi:predicted RNase H-like nuclease (RuvC/YqgF family)
MVTGEGEARLEVSDMRAAQRKIQRLERELREAKEEVDVLKKVLSISSRGGT